MAESSLLPFQPSLAQATNTRLDSACKHIQQCRVSTDDMMRFVGENSDELQRNKYRYCIHKDELVVGLGRPWNGAMVVKRAGNSAYPKVISNLGALTDTPESFIAIQMIRFMNHYARNIRERQLIINYFIRNTYTAPKFRRGEGDSMTDLPEHCAAFKKLEGGKIGTKDFMRMMYDYFATGYANTVGYAHPNTGDTMTSVMIGGLRTVLNGDFEIFAGDLVQFYWCFEKNDFEPDGRRKAYFDIWDGNTPHNVEPSITDQYAGKSVKRDSHDRETWGVRPDAQVREAYYNLSYGQRADKTKIVAKIKPYIPDEINPRLNDWYRVFGVAIASARPNEMCDIKISRQSM